MTLRTPALVLPKRFRADLLGLASKVIVDFMTAVVGWNSRLGTSDCIDRCYYRSDGNRAAFT
jgi:hypothetical protein